MRKTLIKREKVKGARGKAPKTDAFTALCRSELGLECVKEYRFHPIRKWRFDYAIPDYRIALEVEGGVWTGGRHTSPQGFLGDIEKYNEATVMGWAVLRTTPDALISVNTLRMIQRIINDRKDEKGKEI